LKNISAIKAQIRQGLKALHKPEPLKLSEWADENFYLSAESSYIEGKWETIPYQKAMMDCISNDDIREVNVLKSARVGFTKMIVAATAYFAHHKTRNQVFFQPVDQDAKDFVKDEIDPMLRDVPIMRDIFPDYDMKSKNNTLEKKVFTGSTLDIRGGKAAKNYRRLTKDIVYYDELDGFDSDVDNEGDPVTLGDKRVEGSTFPKSIRGSTPKIKGSSLIEHYAESAEMFFRFYVPCPECDGMQYLQWGGKDAPFGLKWEGENHRTTEYLCKHCASLFDYANLPSMLEKGQWRDNDKGVYIDSDSLFRDIKTDSIISPPMGVAFHIWTAYSIMTTWQRMVEEYLRAKDDPNKLKTFINTTLGETWDEDQGDGADPDVLFARKEEYLHEVPDGVKHITVGADTQDDRVEWEYFGWGENEERWSLGYGRLFGDLTSADFWEDLHGKFRREFRDSRNVIRTVDAVCIDSGGHFTDEVYAFSRKYGVRWIFPIKGANIAGKPVVVMPRKMTAKRVYLCEVGSDTAKELIYYRYKLTSGGGSMHFPLYEEYDLEYFRQATSEFKVKTFKRGKPMFVWHLRSGWKAEALDCAVYGLAAMRLLIQHLGYSLDAPVAVTQQNNSTDTPSRSDWCAVEDDWI